MGDAKVVHGNSPPEISTTTTKSPTHPAERRSLITVEFSADPVTHQKLHFAICQLLQKEGVSAVVISALEVDLSFVDGDGSTEAS